MNHGKGSASTHLRGSRWLLRFTTHGHVFRHRFLDGVKTADIQFVPILHGPRPALLLFSTFVMAVCTATSSSSASQTLAQDASCSDHAIPTSFAAEETKEVSVTMQNTGSETWTEVGFYRLGLWDPQDGVLWGVPANRIGLPSEDSIAPGQQFTFSFPMTAPSIAGTYAAVFRMVQDGVAWFGSGCGPTQIIVSDVLPENPSTDDESTPENDMLPGNWPTDDEDSP